MARIDGRSFAIGALSALCAVLFINMNQPDPEMRKLREFAGRLNDRGDLDMGNRKITMLGSQIYDDGSEGGGLQIRGGANRVHVFGDLQLRNQLVTYAPTLRLNSNLDLGNKKIVMLGSQIYDDGSEDGGLQLRGGANRLHLVGDVQLWNQLNPRQATLRIPSNLDLGTRKILMQGSAIWDDGSQGGGLLLQGGANRIHHFGQVIQH